MLRRCTPERRMFWMDSDWKSFVLNDMGIRPAVFEAWASGEQSTVESEMNGGMGWGEVWG